MITHCCFKIQKILKKNNSPLRYKAEKRLYVMEYHLYRKPRKNDLIVSEILHYCPFCGKKFPKELRQEYSRILQEECHIKDMWEQIRTGNIPDEFKTDKWWKKRGL